MNAGSGGSCQPDAGLPRADSRYIAMSAIANRCDETNRDIEARFN